MFMHSVDSGVLLLVFNVVQNVQYIVKYILYYFLQCLAARAFTGTIRTL